MTEQPVRMTGRILIAALVTSVVLLLVALCVRRIWTVDYWWQWKTGEYFAKEGIMHADPFSWSQPGRARSEVRWAFCFAEYWISDWFGRSSMIFVKTGVVLATFAVAIATIGRLSALVTASVVLAVAALASYQRFYERPELISYFCFAAIVFVIERRRRGPTRWIYALPLVQIVWVNCHGSTTLLGPILIGIWVAAEIVAVAWNRMRAIDIEGREPPAVRLRVAAGLLAAMIVASLVNPYGYVTPLESLMNLFILQSPNQKAYWVEFRSPFSFGQQYTAVIFYEILIALTALSVLANLRRQNLFSLALVASQLVLSLGAIRNLPLFAIAAIPFTVRNVQESSWWRKDWARAAHRTLRPALALVVIAGSVLLIREICTNRFAVAKGDTNQFGLGIAEHRYPTRAAAFLKAHDAHGRILNDPATGSHLLSQGFRVFIDTRGEMYYDEQDAEFHELSTHPDTLSKYHEKYDFELACVSTDFTELALAASRLPGWRLVYADCEAVVSFGPTIGRDTPTLDMRSGGAAWLEDVRTHLTPPVPYETRGLFTALTSPAPYRRLASVCADLENYPAARVFLSQARVAYPPGFSTQDLLSLADLAAVAGDRVEATELLLEAAIALPADLALQKRTAIALLNSGGAARAAELLERAIASQPVDAEILGLLGATELKLDRTAAAAEHLERAAALDERNAAFQRALGGARARLGEWDAAVAALETAARLEPDDVNAPRELARLWLRRRDVAKARAWIETALEKSPDDGESRALRAQIEAAASGS